MRVTLLVLNNFTNDARVHKEAVTLAKAGYEVRVVALWQKGLLEEEQSSGYRIHRLRLVSRSWRGGLIAPLVKYLEFAIRFWISSHQWRSQVYHANDANTLPAAWLASRTGKAALVYDAHELETDRSFSNSHLSKIYRRVWALPEKLLIHKSDIVITVSNGIADELVKIYTIPRPAVILNAPELPPPFQKKPDRLRDELGIPPQTKIVLYQGRIASGRGLEALFSAVSHLPDVVAVALGEGPMWEIYRARIMSGEWKRAYLPGKVSLQELPSYTASADIGAILIENTCKSYYLSLPNKLFEFMQAGVPAIGSNLPEIAGIIHKHNIGRVVDPDDPEQIAKEIKAIFSNPEIYKQYAENSLQAAQLYHWGIEGARLIEIYQSLEQKLQERTCRENL
jgi:glycosyltransferase involved in cell wall biosynthesis